MEFLEWLGRSPLGSWVSENQLVYYGLLSGHAIGMGVVVGIVFMLGARVLGLSKSLPYDVFEQLYRLAWAGFGLNLLTGLFLFAANGRHLIENPPFLLKLTFIALGGLTLWALTRTLAAAPGGLGTGGPASTRAKSITAVMLLLWTAAIISGRIIAYTIKYV